MDTLQSLHHQDELLQALSKPPAEEPPGPEPLIARLWALRPPMHLSDTNISGGLLAQAIAGSTGDTEDDLQYLASATEPDELGRLGTYRVLRILGKGGMGVVFLAEDPQLRRLVALKVLRPGLLTNRSAQRRFLRKAQAIAGLTHDHIVSILHVGDENGVPFLAMPLLQGETLEARLQRDSRLPSAEVLRIGREIADGLTAAHLRGLIHRDIKPANVWLEADTSPSKSSTLVWPGRRKMPSPLRRTRWALSQAHLQRRADPKRRPGRHPGVHGSRAGTRRGHRSPQRLI